MRKVIFTLSILLIAIVVFSLYKANQVVESTATVQENKSQPTENEVEVERPSIPLEGKRELFSEELDSNVYVNGLALNLAQLEEFEKRYGQKPPEGNYWYDSRSGLYGAIGHQAYGFMHPGHNYGAMAQNVSNGNTGVITNGRELPLDELRIWEQINGIPIEPGSYWFDANGNAGVEGDATVLVNFFVMAATTGYSGGGSGGGAADPWNTRFSAGNSNANNTAGYVSVPGYGPVGYGF